MSYKRGRPDPLDLPTRCPVCTDKRTDLAAIYIHNLKCSQDGERSYPR